MTNTFIVVQARAPGRSRLTRTLKKIAAEVVEKISDSLCQARRVAITTDIWTTDKCVDSYIGLTAHFVNRKTRKREVYRICCREFNVIHSGLNIARKFQVIFMEYNMETKVFKVLTDNASNMIKAVRDLKELKDGEELEIEEYDTDSSDDDDDFKDSASLCSGSDSEPEDVDEDTEVSEVDKFTNDLERLQEDHEEAFKKKNLERLPCIAHKVQLPILRVTSLKKSKFGKLLRKVRRLVKAYNKSGKAKKVLRNTGHKLRLVGFVKTRWWSDVAMVERVVKAAEYPGNALQKLINKMEWNFEITENDIANLKDYLDIMMPFKTLIERLGGEDRSTIHLVYPSIKELNNHLEELIKNNVQKTFCEALHHEFNNYFKFVLDPEDDSFESFYIIATFLDPFHKGAQDESMTKKAKDCLKQMIKKEMKRGQETEVRDEEVEVMQEDVEEEEEMECYLPGFENLSKSILLKPNPETSNNNDHEVDKEIEEDFEKYQMKSEEGLKKAVDKAKIKAANQRESLKKEGKDNEAKLVRAKVVPEDPLDWWLGQEKKVQWGSILATLAQDILVVPATSVPSERTFSVTGELSKGRFASVKSDTLEKRMLIKCNPSLNSS